MKLKDFNTEEHFKQSFKKSIWRRYRYFFGYYFWRTRRNAETNA